MLAFFYRLLSKNLLILIKGLRRYLCIMLSSSPMIDKTLQVKDFYSEVKRVILTKEPYKSYFGNKNLSKRVWRSS